MTDFAIKIKTKSGQEVIRNLTRDSTIGELKTRLASISNISINRLQVLSGFPPRIFDISNDTKFLHEAGISSGDTLILEEKLETSSGLTEARHHVVDNQLGCPGILMKQIVPADNSCLFTSIHFALNGSVVNSSEVAPLMRELVAETISKDESQYCEAILGKSNKDYCKWILDEKSWGGAIEISVLANHYGIEIDVVDTINGIINRFGEDQKFAHRILLLFDGIHYDPLYLESLEGGSIQTFFPIDEERILKDAEQLALEAKSSRQFTDVDKFTLKCMVCNIMISGQIQAQQHAQSTGHANFGEI